jgi:hypothetical protein
MRWYGRRIRQGRTVNTAYDGANRASGVTGVLNGTTKTYVGNATYAASGAIGGFNYAVTNGVAAGTRTFSYNGNMQLGEIHDQAASLLDLKYFYGGAATTGSPGASTGANNGNPTAIVEAARKGSGTLYNFTQTYGYDRLNRVNAATDTGGWTQNFSFDRYSPPNPTSSRRLAPAECFHTDLCLWAGSGRRINNFL